ncbi:hypothetical protein SESBI_31472 [Sesbania bispinosa]|nr:hypothetical protein SESBI_31472 [Sesbania bispinosa]
MWEKAERERTLEALLGTLMHVKMSNYAMDNNCEVNLYVENTQIVEPVLLEDSTLLTFNKEGDKAKVEQGVVGDQNIDEEKVEQGDVGNNSEDACDGDKDYYGSDYVDGSDELHFPDSEEEGNLGMDDGFKDTNDEQNVVKEMVMKMKTTQVKNPILSPS